MSFVNPFELKGRLGTLRPQEKSLKGPLDEDVDMDGLGDDNEEDIKSQAPATTAPAPPAATPAPPATAEARTCSVGCTRSIPADQDFCSGCQDYCTGVVGGRW